jgi:hypothetical protein
MDRLKASVADIKGVADSAVALINGLAQQLRDAIASGNPADLTALADQLDADKQELADAITANSTVILRKLCTGFGAVTDYVAAPSLFGYKRFVPAEETTSQWLGRPLHRDRPFCCAGFLL